MATVQPSKRKRDPTDHVEIEAKRHASNEDLSDSNKKRQRSPEKLERNHDRQKRPRRDEEKREERHENTRHGVENDRRNGDSHNRDRRDRDSERLDRDKRGGEGRHDRDRRDPDRRHGNAREGERRDRDKDRDVRNGDRSEAGVIKQEVKPEPMDSEEDEAAQMKKIIGFASFRSTKNTKVPGNDKMYGVRKEKKTEYRQYMNRMGGFNRPLSPSR